MKKYFERVLGGMTLGLCILITSYLIINLTLGNEVYINEIENLKNIEVLENQIIGAGFTGALVATVFSLFMYVPYKVLKTGNEKNHGIAKIARETAWRVLGIAIIMILGALVVEKMFENSSEILSMIFFTTTLIAGFIYLVGSVITNKKEIAELNEKIKARK